MPNHSNQFKLAHRKPGRAIIVGMAHVFVARMRDLLTGLTRVTFGGCGGDPGVWEQAAKRRWNDARQEFRIQSSEFGIREGTMEETVDDRVPAGPSAQPLP
jgi:hypothetical protein